MLIRALPIPQCWQTVMCTATDLTVCRCTVVSHQWERAECPFLDDASQLVEHAELISTEFIWRECPRAELLERFNRALVG